MTNWTRQDTRCLIEAAEEKPFISRGAVRVIRRHYAEPRLVERMAALEKFCDLTNGKPSLWGESDCTLRVADWLIANGCPDPAARWRGTYTTESECRRLLASRGGLIGHVAACATAVGLTLLHEPEFGCIAVIGGSGNSDRQWSAIWNGARWMVLWGDERAAHWTPFAAKPLGLWRV